MQSKKLSIFVAGFIFFILLVNYAAMKFHWYYSIAWFDMLMHFLGGLWLGFAFLWLKGAGASYPKILLGVLAVGILWEVFELLIHQQFLQEPFDLPDTFSDLFFDLLGGSVAFFWQKTRNERTS